MLETYPPPLVEFSKQFGCGCRAKVLEYAPQPGFPIDLQMYFTHRCYRHATLEKYLCMFIGHPVPYQMVFPKGESTGLGEIGAIPEYKPLPWFAFPNAKKPVGKSKLPSGPRRARQRAGVKPPSRTFGAPRKPRALNNRQRHAPALNVVARMAGIGRRRVPRKP